MPEISDELKSRRNRALRQTRLMLENLEQIGVYAKVVGSLARDPEEFTESSDIDILVFDSNQKNYLRVMDVIVAHSENIPVDLIFFHTLASTYFRNKMLAEGQDIKGLPKVE